MLRARLATAAVAIPLLLILIFKCPPWAMAVFVGVVAVLGLLEFAGMAFSNQRRDAVAVMVLGTLTIAATTVGSLLEPASERGSGDVMLAALALSYGAGLVWTFLGRRDFERGLSDFGIMLIGILYVGFLLPHFVWLRRMEHGPEWITVILAICMLGDSSGYFVGHAIGRHKLAPRISPGKSVEGALAILVASVLASVVGCAILLPHVGVERAAILGLILGVLAQLGDLAESVMKRSFGIKESGWIFPGHGGVLDRVDSLLFPVAFVYYYTVLSR